MASTIKVNNIQNQCGANIANKCGTTITLGASGDTITLACGASQTGFGRTGTVDWDTTAKTASFTAVSGNGYFVNTTSGAITVTLPASPSAGDIVAISDYASTANTNNITIGRNSSLINGSASDLILSINGKSLTLVYIDGTQGWKIVNNGDQTTQGAAFISATGGTETTCGDYKIHTFTGPGTFTVSNAGNALGSSTVDYMVVAGAGGGGGDRGGGGGAGGWRASSGAASGCYCAGPSPLVGSVSALPVTAQGYPIAVGGGGPGSPGGNQPSAAANGNPSVFSTITSTGGGGGMSANHPEKGQPGGSGGGASGSGGTNPGDIGLGNTPPVSPPQGNNGGKGFDGPAPSSGGGGGGAGAVGQCAGPGNNPAPSNPSSNGAGPGGIGVSSDITGSTVKYAGGGGGAHPNAYTGQWGFGGTNPGGDTTQPQATRFGAGNGAQTPGSTGCAGTANTGGGGGSGACGGANGGSGIVVIRYKFQ